MMSENQSKEILKEKPGFLKDLLEDLEDLLKEPEHKKKDPFIEFSSALIWQLLSGWCAASEECKEILMKNGILKLLRISLESNINNFYKEIFHSSTCLWHLILAEKTKYLEEIRKDKYIISDMQTSTHFQNTMQIVNSSSFFYLIGKNIK